MPPLVASVNSSSFPADVASAGARHGECAEPQVRQNTGHEGFKEDNSRSGVEDDPPSTLAPASVSAADELRVRPSASNQGGGSKPCPLAADHTAVASAAVGFVPDGWQPADGDDLAFPQAGGYPADPIPVDSGGPIDAQADDAAASAPAAYADVPEAGAGPESSDAPRSLTQHAGIPKHRMSDI
jgi:hypothetical protein